MISSDIIPQSVRDLQGETLQFTDSSGKKLTLLINPWKIVVMKSARTGFTSILENAIGYHADYDPCPTLMAQPRVEDARRWSKISLAPLFRDTPALQGILRETRVKDSNNTILEKHFPGGFIRVIGAKSPDGFRGITVRLFLFDELDSAPLSAGSEGAPLQLGERRTATVWNRKVIVGSTPTIAGISAIEFQYAISNQMHYYVPCPRCRHFQILVFSPKSMWAQPSWRLGDTMMIGELTKGYLKFDPDNCTWTYYLCEHCKEEISEQHKNAMVASGQWRAAVPEVVDIAGFHVSELYSPFNTSWLLMAKDFLVAKQQIESLRVFINQRTGETFEELDALTLNESVLLQRVEDYENVPEGAYLLTAGADIQGDRIEVIVRAWGDGDESWLLEHVVLPGSPHEHFVWDLLDDYLHKEFLHARSTPKRPVKLRIRCAFIDSSAYTTDVYRFTAPREGRGIFSIKGHDGSRKLFTPSGRDRRTHAALYILGVDDAKQKIYDRLQKKLTEEWKPGMPVPGYMHFNKHATLSYFQQLTSERRIRKVTRKGVSLIWDLPRGRRNEVLDMEVYALCAMELIRPVWDRVKINFAKHLKELSDSGPLESREDSEEESMRPRFIGRSKSKWPSKI